jgi:hypothetical protein
MIGIGLNAQEHQPLDVVSNLVLRARASCGLILFKARQATKLIAA